MADTAITIARNRTTELSLAEQARGFSNKFNVKYSDIAYGSGSTEALVLTDRWRKFGRGKVHLLRGHLDISE